MNDIAPPKTHDLQELLKLCAAFKPQFSTIYEECSVLSGYAVQTRYPNEISVEKQDMDKALLYAKSVREFILPFTDENGSLQTL